MKNLVQFESYKSVNEAEEAAMIDAEMEMVNDFDPEKAKQALADYIKRTGSGTTDADGTGLNFPNIKQVFGRQDYNFRVAIAQALFLANMNLFPTNKYHSKDIQSLDLKETGLTTTYYIGEASQNEKLKTVKVPQLQAIKSLAAKIYMDQFGKYFGGSFGLSGGKYKYQFNLGDIQRFPEVKAATAALAKVY
jgi:hypothetical protein